MTAFLKAADLTPEKFLDLLNDLGHRDYRLTSATDLDGSS